MTALSTMVDGARAKWSNLLIFLLFTTVWSVFIVLAITPKYHDPSIVVMVLMSSIAVFSIFWIEYSIRPVSCPILSSPSIPAMSVGSALAVMTFDSTLIALATLIVWLIASALIIRLLPVRNFSSVVRLLSVQSLVVVVFITVGRPPFPFGSYAQHLAKISLVSAVVDVRYFMGLSISVIVLTYSGIKALVEWKRPSATPLAISSIILPVHLSPFMRSCLIPIVGLVNSTNQGLIWTIDKLRRLLLSAQFWAMAFWQNILEFMKEIFDMRTLNTLGLVACLFGASLFLGLLINTSSVYALHVVTRDAFDTSFALLIGCMLAMVLTVAACVEIGNHICAIDLECSMKSTGKHTWDRFGDFAFFGVASLVIANSVVWLISQYEVFGVTHYALGIYIFACSAAILLLYYVYYFRWRVQSDACSERAPHRHPPTSENPTTCTASVPAGTTHEPIIPSQQENPIGTLRSESCDKKIGQGLSIPTFKIGANPPPSTEALGKNGLDQSATVSEITQLSATPSACTEPALAKNIEANGVRPDCGLGGAAEFLTNQVICCLAPRKTFSADEIALKISLDESSCKKLLNELVRKQTLGRSRRFGRYIYFLAEREIE